MRRISFKSLYWRISAVFLLVLVLLGVAFNFLTLFSAEMYFQEGNQRLHRQFASFIAELLQPYTRDTLEHSEIMQVFEQVHKMNPSVEVYLLDEEGNILSSSTTRENLKLHRIDIQPIQKFLAVDGKQFTMGEDPKGIHKEKVFTAAPFIANGKQVGYVYVILGGEEYDSALQFIQQNYILRLAVRTLVISMVAATIIGLVSIGFLTRRLRKMTKAVTSFGSGDLSQRIPIVSDDEIGVAARAFNQMADTIQRHVGELAAADSLRRELIANVSHDLRTPLSSMQGYVETVILKDGSLTGEERQQYLRTILDSTIKLNKLVGELFELSKLDAKQTLPKPEPFSLTELVQDVTQKFQPQAQKNGVRIETKFDKDLPFVQADIGMIERVLQNLIENAIKFTPEYGRVVLHIDRIDTKLKVKVTDTGCGISKSDLPNIFDRFYRSSRNRPTSEGAGLGLAIVKKILELHGESIIAHSDETSGSTFTFTLSVFQN
ncbi:MAG: HAMP domain-containing histidine kinase [Ignavibacteriae bacterium]|nr:HAMP domain-containing histidine kinase [Ignavibacteria bacterium]MBI3365075.1 HAMP domain-containing histidine kinase [Ignavibacteriota bacterium]